MGRFLNVAVLRPGGTRMVERAWVRPRKRLATVAVEGRSVVGVPPFAQRLPHLGAAAAVVEALEVGGVDLVGLV